MDEAPSTRPSLLIRLRDPGDERAWSEFTEIYGPLVHRLARRRGLQDADAQDLVQEVFRAVARAIERYDPDPDRGSFRGWLSRIARNLIINLLAARRRHPQGTGDTDVQRLLEDRPDPAGEDSALFEAEYRRRLFAWAAERVRGEFSEAAWQAFWQTGVEGRPPKEVAEALGMTVGTVYQYKSRAVVRIRREIEQFGVGVGRGILGDSMRWHRRLIRGDCNESRLRSFLDDGLPEPETRPSWPTTSTAARPAGARSSGSRRGAGCGSSCANWPPSSARRPPRRPADRDGRGAAARGRAKADELIPLDFLAPADHPGLARPAGAVRGDRGARPRRLRRRPQGVRPGAGPLRRDQGPRLRARRQRGGPPPVRPRGEGGRRGRPRPRRRHPRRRLVERLALPGHALRRRPLAPGAGRPGRAAGGQGGPADRHADGARAGRGPRPGAGPSRHQALEHPAGERRRAGQARPTSAWPAPSTTPA